MKYLIRLLLLIFISGFLPACSYKCEDFSTAILEWMPYKEGDTFELRDSIASYTFTVTQSLINHTVKVNKRATCICEDRFILEMSTSFLHVDTFFHNSQMAENSDVVVNNELLLFSEHATNREINGTTYAEIMIYKNQGQSTTSNFKELIIARTVGIISIKGATVEWVRVNDDPRQLDPAKIIFNDHSCV